MAPKLTCRCHCRTYYDPNSIALKSARPYSALTFGAYLRPELAGDEIDPAADPRRDVFYYGLNLSATREYAARVASWRSAEGNYAA